MVKKERLEKIFQHKIKEFDQLERENRLEEYNSSDLSKFIG